jgi:hypothetical protein
MLAEGTPPGSYFHVAKAVGDGFHNEVWRENLLPGPWYFFTGASAGAATSWPCGPSSSMT